MSRKIQGTKYKARMVAPNKPPAIVIAKGGQNPVSSTIRGTNPTMVVNVVATTCRAEDNTTRSIARRDP